MNLKRLGTVEDIAGAIEFMASDNAKYINGESLLINGKPSSRF